VQSLDLESGIALIPPRDFEGITFSFHINFNNIGELQRRLSRLTEVSASPLLNNILNGCRISDSKLDGVIYTQEPSGTPDMKRNP
jgi:hypothetical protein